MTGLLRIIEGEKSGDSKKIVNIKSNLRIATFFPLRTTKPSSHPEASARDLQKQRVAIAFITIH
jgi:hypothetical protein